MGKKIAPPVYMPVLDELYTKFILLLLGVICTTMSSEHKFVARLIPSQTCMVKGKVSANQVYNEYRSHIKNAETNTQESSTKSKQESLTARKRVEIDKFRNKLSTSIFVF